jgi:transposase
MLKHRIHSTLITFGRPCPVTDLFGVAGRELLDRLEIPQPWRSTVDASIALIDDLERQIDQINRQLRAGSADHPYVPLLLTVPGIGWVLAFTIAHRPASPPWRFEPEDPSAGSSVGPCWGEMRACLVVYGSRWRSSAWPWSR